MTTTTTTTPDGLAAIRRAHPWPARRPPLPPDPRHGWFNAGNRRLLARLLGPETRVVVELGSWLGASTRYLARRAPNATVVAVDHWLGSPEHQGRPDVAALLPTLYESFLACCWMYRDRIVPVRFSTLEGMRRVAEAGVQPDLVYVDAAHDTASVLADLRAARSWWPGVPLVGDDWLWSRDGRFTVREAVEALLEASGDTLDVDENCWTLRAPR